MARQFVVLALVLFAAVGLAYANAPKAAASAPASSDSEDIDDSVIGLTDESADSPNAVQAGPLGAPVSHKDFPPSANPPSAASALQISAIAGVATTVLAGFFYF